MVIDYTAESNPLDVKSANLPAIMACGTLTVSPSVRDVSESLGKFCVD